MKNLISKLQHLLRSMAFLGLIAQLLAAAWRKLTYSMYPADQSFAMGGENQCPH